MMKNIIVLEDNKEINAILTKILTAEGYRVFSSYHAIDALMDFRQNRIDCILTDLMLPIMSGEDFIAEVRKESNVHIIAISAKTATHDKLEALKKGADDYLFKPFLEEEVRLKLRNLFAKQEPNQTIRSFDNQSVIFEEGSPQLIVNQRAINLTGVEYQLLRLLIQEHNKICSREQILDVLYSYDANVYDRVVDVHVKNIRKKIRDVYDKELIETVYGLGYMFVGDPDE